MIEKRREGGEWPVSGKKCTLLLNYVVRIQRDFDEFLARKEICLGEEEK